jgi:hypothetical protein
MSYATRVYRQRNAHTHDEVTKASFFGKQHDITEAPGKSPFFQAKLSVNQPGDRYEKEADEVASAVANNPSKTPVVQQKKISGIQRLSTSMEDEKLSTNDARMLKDKEIQRKCAECEKEEVKGAQMKEEKKEAETIQSKANGTASSASPSLSGQIEGSAGKGKSLSPKTLHEMQFSFGVDFSHVNVHTDAAAAQMNKELHAQAFTYGNDIYFNSGKYDPETSDGKQLIAHELTHVIQQNSGIHKESIQRTIGDTIDMSSPRFKGNVELEACFDGEKIIRFGERGEHVRLIQQALIDAGFPLPKFGADGIFKDETKAAVREFQKQSGLEASQQDGEVGPITMSRLDSRFTGASATTAEQTCEKGIKTINIDVVKMRGATGNPSVDIAFANAVFSECCIQFAIGTQVIVPNFLSDFLLGGNTDFLVGGCDSISSEDLITFLTTTTLFGLSNPVVAVYVDTLHEGTERLRGVSVSGLCATGPRSPMEGMVSIANGVDTRTFPHELAHVLMNTFADHRVTADNLQHISAGATGERIAPVQCAIMYTRAR